MISNAALTRASLKELRENLHLQEETESVLRYAQECRRRLMRAEEELNRLLTAFPANPSPADQARLDAAMTFFQFAYEFDRVMARKADDVMRRAMGQNIPFRPAPLMAPSYNMDARKQSLLNRHNHVLNSLPAINMGWMFVRIVEWVPLDINMNWFSRLVEELFGTPSLFVIMHSQLQERESACRAHRDRLIDGQASADEARQYLDLNREIRIQRREMRDTVLKRRDPLLLQYLGITSDDARELARITAQIERWQRRADERGPDYMATKQNWLKALYKRRDEIVGEYKHLNPQGMERVFERLDGKNWLARGTRAERKAHWLATEKARDILRYRDVEDREPVRHAGKPRQTPAHRPVSENTKAFLAALRLRGAAHVR